MKNIKLTLAYSGTNYFGFQKTKMGPSIQETLEKVLELILQHPIKIEGASRTDRGVHAQGQTVHFFTDKEVDLTRLYVSLRGLLPKDISPITLEWMPETFHASLNAKGKEYHYQICNLPTQLPFHREYSWHFYEPIDLSLMEKAKKHLIGTNDFSAFSPENYEDPIRRVDSIEILPLADSRILIKIQGENFLYKMVRGIVGTLAYIGSQKIPLSMLSTIIEKKDRKHAGVTAPAHGLILQKVFY